MANVLIDPKMFVLQTEDAIRNNIGFFRNIIELSNSGQISVCLYKEIIDQLSERKINPFPVNIADIKNLRLRDALLQLNNSFVRSIMNNYVLIDIDECGGLQEFNTNRKNLQKTNEYYAFFGMLLTQCYTEINISDKVFVGKIEEEGVIQGEQVKVECKCEAHHYIKVFSWVSPYDYLSEQQKAQETLRKIIIKKDLYVKSPKVKKGQHHNHIQKGDFDCYEELATKNKRVFNYLRCFGLYKIIFAEFAPDTKYEYGAIKIMKVEETSDSDIVEGWLYACLDFRIKVKLYFPKGIGVALSKYSNDELLQKGMEELITSLGI